MFAICILRLAILQARSAANSSLRRAADQAVRGKLDAAHAPVEPPLASTAPAHQPADPQATRSASLLAQWQRYQAPWAFGGVAPSQCVPGTDFIVDVFSAAALAAKSSAKFLTHFHADHYKGLARTFSSELVYCSPSTARLVRLKLGVRSCSTYTLLRAAGDA